MGRVGPLLSIARGERVGRVGLVLSVAWGRGGRFELDQCSLLLGGEGGESCDAVHWPPRCFIFSLCSWPFFYAPASVRKKTSIKVVTVILFPLGFVSNQCFTAVLELWEFSFSGTRTSMFAREMNRAKEFHYCGYNLKKERLSRLF